MFISQVIKTQVRHKNWREILDKKKGERLRKMKLTMEISTDMIYVKAHGKVSKNENKGIFNSYCLRFDVFGNTGSPANNGQRHHLANSTSH